MDTEAKATIGQQDSPNSKHPTACESMPDLTRLRYFHGQMLVANDLQTEQDYFREKLKLHNRCLHGYGTVCGLKVVEVENEPECDSKEEYDQHQQDHPPALVRIDCGLAIDCEGNELLVHKPLTVDLWKSLTDAEREQIKKDGRSTLYLRICYCVQAIDPVRPVLPDACNAISECVYSKLRDSVRVKVSTHKPYKDYCRNNCCQKCEDKCLTLAAIDFHKDRPVTASQIRNDVRRWISLYEPVTINGISWVHNAENYTVSEAYQIMRRGLTIEFSRPVLEETINKGVFDVWVLEGGEGRHANLYYVDGSVYLHPKNPKYLVFKQTTTEKLQDGDRIMITVRTDFILDECCRPVDGNHVGGRVPLLERFSDNRPSQENANTPTKCLRPPNRYGPWTSGNGSAGGNFESWFYIKEPTPEYSNYAEPDEPGERIPQQDLDD